jgi:hypothetical protein
MLWLTIDALRPSPFTDTVPPAKTPKVDEQPVEIPPS